MASVKTRFTYIRTETTVQCPHCDYIRPIKNVSSVHEHIKAKHAGTFKHKCKHCTYESAVKQNLDSHILSRHPEHSVKKAKTHTCPSPCCNYAANTKGQLRSHYLLKHLNADVHALLGGKELQCSVCEVAFKSKPAFVYHAVSCLSPDILNKKEVQVGLGLAEEAEAEEEEPASLTS